MSLLHDVLQDLEKRNALPEGMPRSAAAGETVTRRRPVWNRLLLIAAATALVVALLLLLPQLFGDPASSAQSGVDAKPEPMPVAANSEMPSGPATVPGTPDQDSPPGLDQAAEPARRGSGDTPADRSPYDEAASKEPQAPSEPLRSIGADPENVIDAPFRPGEAQPARPESPMPSPAPDPVDPSPDDAPASVSEVLAEPEPRIAIRRSDGGASARGPVERARLALGRGRPDQARAVLEAAIETRPTAVDERLLLARILQDAGYPGAARNVLQAGLASVPSQPGLVEALGRLLLQAGDPGEAVQVIDRHAPSIEQGLEAHLLWGAALHRLGRHTAADERYAAILAVHPNEAQAWLGRALSLDALGRFEQAADAYRRAAETGSQEISVFSRQRLQTLESGTLKPVEGEPTGGEEP